MDDKELMIGVQGSPSTFSFQNFNDDQKKV